MKCYYHPKKDAVAVCEVCGRGVCNDCLIAIKGNSYCKECVENGRVAVSTAEGSGELVTGPTPTSVPSRTLLIIGGAGSILAGFAALLTVFYGGLLSTLILRGFSYYYGDYYLGLITIPAIIAMIVLSVGLILAGTGYLGIKRN